MRFLQRLVVTTFRTLSTSSRLHNEVRVRFAPSPTGHLHLGGLRTALYNYIFAKAHGGRFILRIEDTDQTRLVPGAEEHLQAMLQWTGIYVDEGPIQGGHFGPYKQSERLNLYRSHIETLIKSGAAYHCFCSEQRLELLRKEALRNRQVPRYDNRCRHLTPNQAQDHLHSGKPSVIRLKLEVETDLFEDLVYGRTQHDAHLIEGDPVLIKSDGFPTYHFANVVDDHLMEISHVLRGMEWLTSTPKHLSLYKVLGWSPPKFAHLPLLLNRDGSKLSKRQGDIYVQHFKDAGFLPEALVNFITFCGSGFQENREMRHMQQLIQQFSLSQVSTHSAVLDMDLLPDVNRSHMIHLLTNEKGRCRLISELRENLVKLKTKEDERRAETMELTDEYLLRVLEARKDHISRIPDLCHPDYSYLWLRPDGRREDFIAVSENAEIILREACQEIEGLLESVFEDVKELSTQLRRSSDRLQGVPYAVYMRVLRLALSNLKRGASVAEMISVLGKSEVVQRLNASVQSVIHGATGSVSR